MGVAKPSFVAAPVDAALKRRVEELCRVRIRELAFVPQKEEQKARRRMLLDEALATVASEPDSVKLQLKEIFEELEKQEMRAADSGGGAPGRRPGGDPGAAITCETGILPRTHGSALFTRGQTQALATTTLGTSEDEQRMDDLEGETFKRFMLALQLPPFSVGEVKFMRAPAVGTSPRRAGRAGDPVRSPRQGRVSVHRADRLRHPGVNGSPPWRPSAAPACL